MIFFAICLLYILAWWMRNGYKFFVTLSVERLIWLPILSWPVNSLINRIWHNWCCASYRPRLYEDWKVLLSLPWNDTLETFLRCWTAHCENPYKSPREGALIDRWATCFCWAPTSLGSHVMNHPGWSSLAKPTDDCSPAHVSWHRSITQWSIVNPQKC